MRNCKKRAAVFSLAAILCCSLAAPFGSAATNPSVVIDGKSVQFSESMGAPFVDSNNRTQVPLRAAMEAMGAKVDWDGEVRTAVVSKGSVTVRVPIGAEFVWVNGEKKTNDTAALIKDSRTYLPIRIVAEALGADVGWDGNTKTVKITTHGDPVAWIRSGESWYDNGQFSYSMRYVIDGIKIVRQSSNDISSEYEYTYNTRNQVTRETINSTDYTGGSSKKVTDYTYNNYGLVTHEVSSYYLSTSEVIPGTEVWYEYNSKGDTIKMLTHDMEYDEWNQTDYTYTYDSAGRISQATEKNPNFTDENGKPMQVVYTYRYNSSGRLIEIEEKFKESSGALSLGSKHSYGYDEHGNLVRHTELRYEDGPSSYPYEYEVRYAYSQI